MQRGRFLTVSFPKKIQIETTVLCNGKCHFCPQKLVKREPKYMDDALIRHIVDQTRGRGMVHRPFLLNEPFSDKRMPGIIRYIKEDPTATVELNSNAGLLAPELSEAAIRAGLDVMRFSVDAFSSDVYAQSGRGIDYDRVVKNIIDFIDLRNRLAPSLEVHVRMVDLDINRHQQADYLAFWKEKGVIAEVVPLYNYPWTGQTECVPKPCPKIREEIFFQTDGRAVLCCWDYGSRGVIGDIRENSLEEIWNGARNREWRDLLSEGKRDEITLCSRCDGFRDYDFTGWPGY
ncbi:MAG: radical SAM protein [Chitinivibrionales bacterium]|nr:radical SAM protein [Chitinivibrionales bacterium]MBD3397057.1 radical SAM protein [Chitinivibrionales bacterium]